MGRTLRLIAYFVLVALMVSHEVQATMTCWDRCVDACRDEQIGLTCVPQCFYGNCLDLPTGIAVPLFMDQKSQNEYLVGQRTPGSEKPPPELMAYMEREYASAPNPSSSEQGYAYAPNPSSSEHNRKFVKITN